MSTTSPKRQCPRRRSSGTGGVPLVSLVYLGIGDGGRDLDVSPSLSSLYLQCDLARASDEALADAWFSFSSVDGAALCPTDEDIGLFRQRVTF